MTHPLISDQPGGMRPDAPGRSGSLASLRGAVLDSAQELAGGSQAGTAVTLERPPRAELGDYSTNAALVLAPAVGAPPREVAQRLGEQLAARLGPSLARFEVAGPGFLNLFMEDAWLVGALAEMLADAERYGSGLTAASERVLIEFVSANPTGPMHVGHARNAAYGDALARLLSFHGHEVLREFYVNDAGSQVLKLGESIGALSRGEEVPEDGYRGEYVAELAASLPQASTLSAVELGVAAVAVIVEQLQSSLARFRVSFDSWEYESSLHAGEVSPVSHALTILERQGRTYRDEGAVWLRTTEFGDDKDRVLVRSSGEHTYFASDIAYHQGKRERGFDRQIDVWGADHHGYVARMKAAYEALGGDPAQLELLTMQLVHLVRSGERAQMSKRAGEFVTLDDLVQEIGVDAARWFLLSRSHDTTIDLDLDLAREQSSENPVYYVQYAHARIASMLTRAPAHSAQAAARAQLEARRAGAARRRACVDRAAARLSRGDRRGGRTPRPAPDRRLRAGARTGLHGLLPRLSRDRGRAAARANRFASRCRWLRATRSRAAWICSGSARRRRCSDGHRRRQSKRAISAFRRAESPVLSCAPAESCRLRARTLTPARKQKRECAKQRENGGERHEIGGEIKAVGVRQREHRRAILADHRTLDLRFAASLGDQAGEELPLAVGLRRLGDVQRDFARDAHVLAFDRRQRAAGAHGAGAGGEAAARRDREQRHKRSESSASHELWASEIARCRKACPISPREIATMWPSRSIMKLSGRASVPYERTNSPPPSRRLG